MTASAALPRKMQALYDAMEDFGKDVPMLKMFVAVKGDLSDDPPRHIQQSLGPYVTRLNRRLIQHGQRVEPGRAKGTYRLVRTK